jgi:hypothetical protein
MILEALHHPSAGEVRSRLTRLDVTIRSKAATS